MWSAGAGDDGDDGDVGDMCDVCLHVRGAVSVKQRGKSWT